MSPRRSTLGLVLLGLLLTAGCLGRAERVEDGVIRLTAWVSYNNEESELFQRITDEFVASWNASHPGKPLAISLGRVPFNGLLPKLKTACQTHTTPDICRVDCAHVAPLAFGKAIYALDELPGFKDAWPSIEAARRDYVEAAFDSNVVRVRRPDPSGKGHRWENHLYGLPDQTTCVALFRNKALFRESASELRAAGLDPDRAPATWDELVAYGKVLSRPERQQYAFAMDNSLWWTFPFFNCWGAGFLTTDDGGKLRCVLNSEDGIRALAFKVGLYQDKHTLAGRQTRVEAGAWIPGAISKDTGFINQSYAMCMSGPWNIESFRRAGLDFGVSLVPDGPAGSSSNVGGSDLVVFRSCRHPEVATQFLRHVTSAAVQARWCNELGQIPTARAAFPLVSTDDRPALFTFFRQILRAKARPQVPNYDVLEEIINPEMELALKGVKTPKQALDDSVARIEVEVLAELNE